MSSKEKSSGKTKLDKAKSIVEGAGELIAVAGAIITAVSSVLPSDDKNK